MTRELLNRMPIIVMNKVEYFRMKYTTTEDTRERELIRNSMSAYAHGLADAGMLTNRERQTLFVYMTVPNIK